MSRILNFFLNPTVIKALGFLVVIIIVIFFVPVKETYLKVILVGSIIFLWFLIYLTEKQQAAKSGAAIENALWSQSEDRMINIKPGEKAQNEEMRQKFQEAISALKNTKLGKGKLGNSALYALPWYMIVGPSAAGKTTAIRESELDSPIIDPGTGKKQKIKGVGGTRNCDWWFMNETVLLDTAGRWVSGTEEEDSDEWLSFLRFLKKYRRRKPINGVIVAVSVKDLVEFDERRIEQEAQTLRNRIDELIQELGLVFPVYLMFTKCDLISGFLEMFGDMSKLKRGQVWGQTISLEQLQSMPPETIFENGLGELHYSLATYRLAKLQAEKKEELRRRIFSFPLQFLSIKSKLSLFVGNLFIKNSYHENPMFRGFYFSSGTQEGNPIDIVFKEWSKETGGIPSIVNDLIEPGEKKSYFITDLFKQIIIPDKNLAGMTAGAKKRQYFSAAGALVGVIVLLGLFILGVSTSYRLNSSYLGEIKAVSEAAADIHGGSTQTLKLKNNLDRLEALRLKLEADTPIMRTFGLDVSDDDKLTAVTRRLYFRKAEKIILNPVSTAITRLKGMSVTEIRPDFQKHYDTFKTYLMLGDSMHRAESDFLSNHLTALNKATAEDEEIQQLIDKQVEYYLKYLDQKNTPILSTPRRTVLGIREKLRKAQQPGAAGMYSKIRSGAPRSAEMPSLSLSKILDGTPLNVIQNSIIIPGIFTRNGWENYFFDAIYNQDPPTEDWVLNIRAEQQDEASRNRLKREVALRYFRDYEQQWKKFLNACRIAPFNDLRTAHKNLEILATHGESPLFRILNTVAENTKLPANPTIDLTENEQSSGIMGKGADKVKSFIKKTRTIVQAPTQQYLNRKFRTIHRLMGNIEEEEGPITKYLTSLGEIFGRIDALKESSEKDLEAAGLAKSILGGGGNEFTQTLTIVRSNTQGLPELKKLMEAPIHYSWAVILGSAQNYLNEQWRAEVYDAFHTFSGDFPFNRTNENEAAPESVEEFFGEGGTFASFYEKELIDFIDNRGGRWVAKVPRGGLKTGISFSAQCRRTFEQFEEIKTRLFDRQGAMQFEFEIKPILYRTTSGKNPHIVETVLSIDGQSLVYRNGRAEWESFTWPGSQPIGSSLRIKTRDLSLSPDNADVFQFDGYWAFFRLLNQGMKSSSVYSWTFNKQDRYQVKISFQFRSRARKNPFKKGLFSGFRCPRKIG